MGEINEIDDKSMNISEKKKISNREAANRSRQRKDLLLDGLDKQIHELNNTNHTITLENAKLETENRILKEHLSFLNNVLRKHLNDNPIKTPIGLFAQTGDSCEI